MKGNDKSICCLKLLESNRNYLASGSSDARILIWDCLTSSRLHTLDGHDNGSWVACLTELPCGFLASGGGCFDGRIKVWDIANNKPIHSLKDFQKERYWNQIYSLKVLPQSQDLFVRQMMWLKYETLVWVDVLKIYMVTRMPSPI